MTQTEAILNFLKTGSRLTAIDALNKFGCFRLAARCADLRLEGYNIITETVTKNGKTFAEYHLAEGISREVSASSFKKQAELLEIPRIPDYNDFAV